MRGKQTVRDMVLSMGAIGAVVAGVYVFIPHDDSHDPIKRVDYTVELTTARRAAPYPLAAPQRLPEEWKPTSVRYDGQADAAWHLGYLDPQRQYVAVEQSTGTPGKFIERVTRGAEATEDTRKIDGETWTRYEGQKYDALVLEGPDVTTVVTGTATEERLAEMAGALEGGRG